jgi:hypothetical protein
MRNLTDESDLQPLLGRLAEAIDWCASGAALTSALTYPDSSLRTPELAPQPLAGSRHEVVDSVCRARHIALGWPRPRPITDLAGGRLLAYEPDVNLADGAAMVATGGYLDVDNVPPWDTWVDYVDEVDGASYLVSWVPPSFVESVSDGVEANPEQCIWWLDEGPMAFGERSTILARRLAAWGLW